MSSSKPSRAPARGRRHVLHVPRSLLVIVFRYLPSADVFAVSCVCKAWYFTASCSDVWVPRLRSLFADSGAIPKHSVYVGILSSNFHRNVAHVISAHFAWRRQKKGKRRHHHPPAGQPRGSEMCLFQRKRCLRPQLRSKVQFELFEIELIRGPIRRFRIGVCTEDPLSRYFHVVEFCRDHSVGGVKGRDRDARHRRPTPGDRQRRGSIAVSVPLSQTPTKMTRHYVPDSGVFLLAQSDLARLKRDRDREAEERHRKSKSKRKVPGGFQSAAMKSPIGRVTGTGTGRTMGKTPFTPVVGSPAMPRLSTIRTPRSPVPVLSSESSDKGAMTPVSTAGVVRASQRSEFGWLHSPTPATPASRTFQDHDRFGIVVDEQNGVLKVFRNGKRMAVVRLFDSLTSLQEKEREAAWDVDVPAPAPEDKKPDSGASEDKEEDADREDEGEEILDFVEKKKRAISKRAREKRFLPVIVFPDGLAAPEGVLPGDHEMKSKKKYEGKKGEVEFRVLRRDFSMPFWREIVPLVARDLPAYLLKQTLNLPRVPKHSIRKVRILGKSLFGTAYKCKWLGEGGGITVVGKEYLLDLPADVIQKEIGLYKSFDFPLIRRVYGYVKFKRYFLVLMEYIKDSLYQLYRREVDTLSWADRWKLTKKMIQATHYVHSQGIVHKSLKSGNFLVTKSRKLVKICDFSMVYESFATLKSARWSSPEVLTENAFSKASDIFAIGMTIFELVTMGIPFEHVKEDLEVRDRIIRGERPPIPEGVPEEFVALIQSCWRDDPEDRPTTEQLLEFIAQNSERFVKKKTEEDVTFDYEILGQVGKGGFGTVFKAVRRDTGALIAIKRIMHVSGENLNDAEVEISFLRRLNHKNIIKYLGSKKGKDGFSIFLEFAAQGSLDVFFKKNFPSVRERTVACQIYLKHILAGLLYLHGKGVIHRDLKPRNILIDKGIAKLCDFGASKEILRDTEDVKMTLVGTKPYLPPELIHNIHEYRIIPTAFDVWSLGVTISEIMTTKHLFDLDSFSSDETGYLLLNHIVNLKRPPVIPPCIENRNLRDLIRSCLQLNPEHRATIRELMNHPFFSEKLEKEKPKEEVPVMDDLANEMEDFDLIEDYVSEVSVPPAKEG